MRKNKQINNFAKKYKKLYKQYKKELTYQHKTQLKSMVTPIPYLMTYLEFMRDYLTITLENEAEFNAVNLGHLISGLQIYQEYKQYLAANQDRHGKLIIPVGKSKQEATADYLKQCNLYLASMWTLLTEFMMTQFTLLTIGLENLDETNI